MASDLITFTSNVPDGYMLSGLVSFVTTNGIFIAFPTATASKNITLRIVNMSGSLQAPLTMTMKFSCYKL